jgi:AraC-like DNA-binding protein
VASADAPFFARIALNCDNAKLAAELLQRGGGSQVSHQYSVEVRFHRPPPELHHYFTTFYCVDMWVAGDDLVSDYLHPEWSNLRFYSGTCPEAQADDGTPLRNSTFAATGPSSKAVRFGMGTSRMWGIGLLPLGWAKFVASPASDYANAVVDGHTHPAFAPFVPLARTLFSGGADESAELERITRYFAARLGSPLPDEHRILAIHSALVDPEVKSVADLVERAGIGQRTVERICDRAFGFRPKVLLRRQRFMRSLAQYMLDPSLRWIGAMDGHYHDQAQFVRDFRQFMGMTPREYAALDKPIIGAIMDARTRYAMAAVQTLDVPNRPA